MKYQGLRILFTVAFGFFFADCILDWQKETTPVNFGHVVMSGLAVCFVFTYLKPPQREN